MLAVRTRLRSQIGELPSTFWVLWCGLLVNRLASFVGPFLATYLVRVRGSSAASAGKVVALFGVGLMLAGPLGGALADRFGRRATMAAGLMAGGLSVGALAFARPIPVLMVLSFVCGLTTELYRPAMAAAIADVVPAEDRSRAYGLMYWAVGIGSAVGMGFGGALADHSIVALFSADGATTFVFAAIVLARVPETRPSAAVRGSGLRALARPFRNSPFTVFLVLHLAAMVVFAQWQLGLPLDMSSQGLRPSAFAVVLVVNCVEAVLLQPLVASRLKSFDSGHLLAVTAVLLGAGYGVNALGTTLLIYVIGTCLWTFGEIVGLPTSAALVANLAPPELRGSYQGAYSMVSGLAFVISPLLGGRILDSFGRQALWRGCVAIGLLTALGHLFAGAVRRRSSATVPMEGPTAGYVG